MDRQRERSWVGYMPVASGPWQTDHGARPRADDDQPALYLPPSCIEAPKPTRQPVNGWTAASGRLAAALQVLPCAALMGWVAVARLGWKPTDWSWLLIMAIATAGITMVAAWRADRWGAFWVQAAVGLLAWSMLVGTETMFWVVYIAVVIVMLVR